MSNLEKTEKSRSSLPVAAVAAMLRNDWSGVGQSDRAIFVSKLCESLNVPGPLNPFIFVTMKGKEVLYAPASAFFLIASKNGISTEIKSKGVDKDTLLFEVEVRASTQGRFSDNIAAVSIFKCSGDDLANAKMKAVTKAQRRAIKSLVGLNVLDDDDLPFIKEVAPTTQLEVNPVPPTPVNQVDQEKQAFLEQIFDALYSKGAPFENKQKEGEAYVFEKMGKSVKNLDILEMENFLSIIEKDFAYQDSLF